MKYIWVKYIKRQSSFTEITKRNSFGILELFSLIENLKEEKKTWVGSFEPKFFQNENKTEQNKIYCRLGPEDSYGGLGSIFAAKYVCAYLSLI